MISPPLPPLLPTDAMLQAEAASKHLLAHQQAAAAAKRICAAIKESIKLFEGNCVTQAAVEDAIAHQKTFEAVKADYDYFNSFMACIDSPLLPFRLIPTRAILVGRRRCSTSPRPITSFFPPRADIIELNQSSLTPLENIIIQTVNQAYTSQ